MTIALIINRNSQICVNQGKAETTTVETIDQVLDVVKFEDTLVKAVDLDIVKDVTTDANLVLQQQNSGNPENPRVTCTGTYGGKKSSHKKTQKKVKVQGKERVVYKGPRGGEYVKIGGAFKSLKSL